MVEENRSSIIITAHHYVLKDTTVASANGKACAVTKTARGKSGITATIIRARRGASFLTGWTANRTPARSRMFWRPRQRVSILARSAHSHEPRRHVRRESHIEQRWGTTFINVRA